MNTYEQRLSLLAEMIEFARVDGELHERELEFLALVARQLKISQDAFIELFRQPYDKIVIRDENQRIHQFYRLALLMQCDDVRHDEENKSIHELGINMGLNPAAMDRVLKMMAKAPNGILEPEQILGAFREQHN